MATVYPSQWAVSPISTISDLEPGAPIHPDWPTGGRQKSMNPQAKKEVWSRQKMAVSQQRPAVFLPTRTRELRPFFKKILNPKKVYLKVAKLASSGDT